MKKSVVDGYVEKFSKLMEVLVYVENVFQEDIRPANKDEPENGIFWERGATNGAFMYFLRTLTGEEHKISQMVFDQLKADNKESFNDFRMDVMDYIEASIPVLEKFGVKIKIP